MEFVVYNRNDEYMGLVTLELYEIISSIFAENELYIEEFEEIEDESN